MKLVAVTVRTNDGIDEIRGGVFRVVRSNPQFSQAFKSEHTEGSRVLDLVQKLKFDRVGWEVKDEAVEVRTKVAQQTRGRIR